MNTVTPLGHIIVDYANCNVTLGTYRLRERVCPSWKKLKDDLYSRFHLCRVCHSLCHPRLVTCLMLRPVYK